MSDGPFLSLVTASSLLFTALCNLFLPVQQAFPERI